MPGTVKVQDTDNNLRPSRFVQDDSANSNFSAVNSIIPTRNRTVSSSSVELIDNTTTPLGTATTHIAYWVTTDRVAVAWGRAATVADAPLITDSHGIIHRDTAEQCKAIRTGSVDAIIVIQEMTS